MSRISHLAFLPFALYGALASPTCLSPVISFDPLVEYFPQNQQLEPHTDFDLRVTDDGLTTVKYASLFEVTYYRHYKHVKTLKKPGVDNQQETDQEYVLYQCGTPKPVNAAFGTDAKFFKVPVEKAATGGSIPSAFIEDLEVEHQLHLTDGASISSNCLLKQILECEHIAHHSMGSKDWQTNEIDATMAAWRGNLTTTDEIGVVFTDGWGTGASHSDKDVILAASLDDGLLHTAEWIKFISLWFNAEAKANQKFSEEVVQVDNIKAIVQSLNLDEASKPKVAWTAVSGHDGSTSVEYSEYRSDFVTSAGGVMFNNESTTVDSPEALMELLKGVDVLFDKSYQALPHTFDKAGFLDLYRITQQMIDSGDWPFLTNNKVFRVDRHHSEGIFPVPWTPDGKAYPLEWFSKRMTDPNVFLADVAYAIHPSHFTQYSDTYFLRNMMLDQSTIQNGPTKCNRACPAPAPAPPPPAPSPSPPEDSSSTPPEDNSSTGIPLSLCTATFAAVFVFVATV